MDTGDEAAQEIYRDMQQSAEKLIRWLIARSGSLSAHVSSINDRARKLKESRLADLASLEEEERAACAGAPCPTKVLYAGDAAEVDRLASFLDDEGIEYYLRLDDIPAEAPCDERSYRADQGLGADNAAISKRPSELAERGPCGTYKIYLPDRPYPGGVFDAIQELITGESALSPDEPHPICNRLASLPEDLREDIFSHHSLATALEHAAMSRACGLTLQTDSPQVVKDFLPGAKGNFTMRIETVQWDRDAQLVADWLDKAGIPSQNRMVSESVAEVEIARANAPYAIDVIDAISDNVRMFNHDRVMNFDELKDAAFGRADDMTEILQADVPQAAAPFIKEQLRQAGVDFAAIAAAEEGFERLSVKASDIDANRDALEKVASRGLTPEQAARALARQEHIVPGERAIAEARAKGARGMDAQTKHMTKHEAPTIDRDDKRARKALDALERTHEAPVKTKTKAKG